MLPTRGEGDGDVIERALDEDGRRGLREQPAAVAEALQDPTLDPAVGERGQSHQGAAGTWHRR